MTSSRLIVVTATLLGTFGAVACSASSGESVPASAVDNPAPPGGTRTVAQHEGRVGAPGIGDPDFPTDGNGGYDVAHYRLKIDYDPPTKRLSGVAGIEATSTQDLSSFNLDLTGFDVSKITVDGKPATFERAKQELTVTPAAFIPDKTPFKVEVSYAGEPKPVQHSTNLGTYGFIPTKDGAFVACEPNGARTWFPGNDHPADKARYDFRDHRSRGDYRAGQRRALGEPKTSDGARRPSSGRRRARWRPTWPP